MTLINTHAAKGLILCGFTAEGQVLFSYIAIMQSKAAVCNKGLPHNQGIPTLAMTSTRVEQCALYTIILF